VANSPCGQLMHRTPRRPAVRHPADRRRWLCRRSNVLCSRDLLPIFNVHVSERCLVLAATGEKSTRGWMCALRTGNASYFGLEVWRMFPRLLGHGDVRRSVSTMSVVRGEWTRPPIIRLVLALGEPTEATVTSGRCESVALERRRRCRKKSR
jgi:hypothetical protein